MEEEFEEVFRFEDQAVTWRDDYSLNIRQIENLRQKGIQSFGSCSFDEPIADLQKLGYCRQKAETRPVGSVPLAHYDMTKNLGGQRSTDCVFLITFRTYRNVASR